MTNQKKKESLGLEQLLESKEQDKLIKELSFEEGLKLLEQLVEKVEGGALTLDQSISAYEKGVGLLSQLRAHLARAEEKLKVLEEGRDG